MTCGSMPLCAEKGIDMLKGLALTPPVLGRISIGHVVEKGGKRVPEKDDEFTITTQIQGKDGWIVHPLDEEIRNQTGGKLDPFVLRGLREVGVAFSRRALGPNRALVETGYCANRLYRDRNHQVGQQIAERCKRSKAGVQHCSGVLRTSSLPASGVKLLMHRPKEPERMNSD